MSYPIAELDQTDLRDVQGLERRLTDKHGRPIILIAYTASGEALGEGALGSTVAQDPDLYGTVQAVRETGIDFM